MYKLVLLLFAPYWLSCGNQVGGKASPVRERPQKTTVAKDIAEIPPSVDTLAAVVKNTDSTDIAKEEPIPKVEAVPATTEDIEVIDPSKTTGEPEITKKNPIPPGHSSWNVLLKKYVTPSGDVDYEAFLNDKETLQAYLDVLAQNSPEATWSKNEKLAYYINLYNAATVKLILDNYPTKSIKDISRPWDKKWIKIGESTISLGAIEHKILRKMNEPRIHFAINCASYSCPKLLNEAFTTSQMENQLEAATRDFINDTSRNKIATEQLELSNIFKWYKKDFTDKGTLVDYINPYTSIAISSKADIDYLKYDWSLNEAK